MTAYVPFAAMNPLNTLTVADRLAMTLDGLSRAVAARSARGPSWLGSAAALAGVLVTLIWGRVKRADGQIQALLARFRAGKLRVMMGAPRQEGPREAGARVPRGAKVAKVPRGFGWLLPLVPCEAAGFAAQLRLHLADPEMVALLAASAQARRAMMTLGHMLMIEPELIAPKPVDPDVAVAEVSAAVGEAPTGWPGFLPPAPPPAAPDFRYFRDGTRPQGPPSSGAG